MWTRKGKNVLGYRCKLATSNGNYQVPNCKTSCHITLQCKKWHEEAQQKNNINCNKKQEEKLDWNCKVVGRLE
jgi:hypothetical protein